MQANFEVATSDIMVNDNRIFRTKKTVLNKDKKLLTSKTFESVFKSKCMVYQRHYQTFHITDAAFFLLHFSFESMRLKKVLLFKELFVYYRLMSVISSVTSFCICCLVTNNSLI